MSWSALPVLGLAAVLVVLPFVGASPYTITLTTDAMVFAIWAMSLDLLVGYTGLVSFGHAAAFGLSAYAAGYFAREVSSDFLLALLVAEGVVGVVAAALGFIATRVSGIAFAVISLCIAQVLFTIAVVWRTVTNGMDGMVGVPLPTIGGIRIDVGHAVLLSDGRCAWWRYTQRCARSSIHRSAERCRPFAPMRIARHPSASTSIGTNGSPS